MNEQKPLPETEFGGLTGTAVVYREVEGTPELVIVCGECSTIHTIGVKEAMNDALQHYMFRHRERKHLKEKI